MRLAQAAPINSYAYIGGDKSRVWSAREQVYVSSTDPVYLAYAKLWATLNYPDELYLTAYLGRYGIIGPHNEP